MLQFDFRQVIICPVAEVFEYSSNPRNILASDPTAVVATMDGDLRKGSNFQINFDGGRKNATITVIEYDPPNFYEFEANVKIPTTHIMRGSYAFTELDGKTEMRVDMRISDISPIMEILFREKIRKSLQENLESTKVILEARGE